MAEKKEVDAGTPAWTQQDERQGLDPLGMQNTSISLYQWLVPGVSNVTLRMRYYALHSWLAHEYARAHHSPDVEEWCRFLRRGEALYALISQHQVQENGVAGNRWAGKTLKNLRGERIAFAAHADSPNKPAQYLRQKFGAFGAAYSSQLQVVGLIEAARDHNVPIVTESTGKALASAFGAEVGSAGRQFLQSVASGVVTLADLKRMARMAPARIDEETEERKLYEQVLFAPGAKGALPALRRRDTLRVVLHTARQLKALPDAADVRWSAYSGHDGAGKPLPPLPSSDAEHRYRWRVYHANDLTHVCHETLLRFVLEVLAGYPGGIPLRNLLAEVIARLLAVAKPRPGTWAQLEAAVTVPANAWSEEPDAEWQLSEELLGVKMKAALTAKTAYLSLRLLAVLGKRLRAERERMHSVLAHVAYRESQTVLTEPAFMDARRDLPIEQALADLLKQRILDRHLAVAFQKLPGGDYTFLFEVDEGRLRLRKKAGAVLTNPRLKSAIAFLHDIHLLNGDGLTAAGARVLRAA